MPLLKIHVEHAVWQDRQDELLKALKPIRAMLCDIFQVNPSICQVAVIPVFGVDDQPPVAAEIQIMPKPDRTNEVIRHAGERLLAMLADAAGVTAVVRSTQLDPRTYLSLK